MTHSCSCLLNHIGGKLTIRGSILMEFTPYLEDTLLPLFSCPWWQPASNIFEPEEITEAETETVFFKTKETAFFKAPKNPQYWSLLIAIYFILLWLCQYNVRYMPKIIWADLRLKLERAATLCSQLCQSTFGRARIRRCQWNSSFFKDVRWNIRSTKFKDPYHLWHQSPHEAFKQGDMDEHHHPGARVHTWAKRQFRSKTCRH